ncbi:hypothetical protein KPL78_16835 [Roseomonas sp. HJA6]|uniref:Uncharacterized protein n=1 Tax=Roseomonas alba TaxID=2846776 RepID=A0ABS7AB41_9PROT|nr:hypothetical protein [Neoroseomonas alba]MBW6399526.1 hypothetical protein [Neoroseomonas alba]
MAHHPRAPRVTLTACFCGVLFATFIFGGFWVAELIGPRDMLRALAIMAQAVRP